MNYAKKRIAIFLSLLLVLPALLNCIPGRTLVSHAATTSGLSWSYYIGKQVVSENGYTYTDTTSAEIIVEAGQTGLLSSLVSLNQAPYTALNKLSGVKYATDNAAVATITNGVLKTLTTGVANITVTYKGSTTTCTVNVVAKGSLGSGKSSYKKIGTAISSLKKTYGKKITAKNRYKINDALYKINKLYSSNSLTNTGFLNENVPNDYGYSTLKTSNKWVLPALVDYNTISSSMYDYFRKVNPIGTEPSKHLKISKVSGKGNTVQITLKKKITLDQIFGIQKAAGFDTKLTPSNQTVFPMYLTDKSDEHTYYALAIVKKGSKKMEVKLPTGKLIKGHSYILMDSDKAIEEYSWTKNKTFKAK